ncbi:3beta-hydroxysteroid-dehydrogenase/decarboxylase isoform 3 [Morus notabilis]|uniref:Reticulon-like protein n=1 Tax=Morus notabilis TaxID=981085 RepID=W9QKY3_9ROSA|nr:3beta-hydroxysteroid-dehydrogenase/decarboxylase isoform 3 [Morus notabilis]
MQEGVSRTIRSLSHLANDMSFSRYCDRDEPSKVEKLLGGGKVADVLLWRNEKKSFLCFLSLVMLFNWLFLSGRTFVSSAAKLLLLLLFILFGYGALPPNIFGFNVTRIPSTWFEIPEVLVKDPITAIAHLWNKGFHCITPLAKGQYWKIFFKFLTMAVGIALVFAFTAFFVYEQYELEVDGLAKFLRVSVKELAGSLGRNLPHSVFLTMAVGIALVFAFTAFFVYEQYELEVDGLAKFLCVSVKELAGSLGRNLPHSVVSFLCNFRILGQDKRTAAVKHWK